MLIYVILEPIWPRIVLLHILGRFAWSTEVANPNVKPGIQMSNREVLEQHSAMLNVYIEALTGISLLGILVLQLRDTVNLSVVRLCEHICLTNISMLVLTLHSQASWNPCMRDLDRAVAQILQEIGSSRSGDIASNLVESIYEDLIPVTRARNLHENISSHLLSHITVGNPGLQIPAGNIATLKARRCAGVLIKHATYFINMMLFA